MPDTSGVPDTRPFLIAAASGRALAASAHGAGYRVAVLDLFSDTDLAALTTACEEVPRGDPDGFDEGALLEAADRLAPKRSAPAWGLVYGSGFEGRPDLLERLAAGRRLFGNGPEALVRAKDPHALFALLDDLAIPHPETRSEPPPEGERARWLVKRVGGAGGLHVRAADVPRADAPRPDVPRNGRSSPGGREPSHERRHYYQRRIEGRSVSALVVSDGAVVQVLGLSEQWPCPGRPMQPFRFGGAAGPAVLAPALARDLAAAATAVVRRLELVGLNSVDFIVPEKDPAGLAAIEVNPRPGATMDIFERAGPASLFDLHIRAAAGDLAAPPAGGWFPPDAGFASAILYAEDPITIPTALTWPDWTADRPRAGTPIGAGEPVCTILAEVRASRAEGGAQTPTGLAKGLALRRAEALRGTIGRCIQSSPE